MPRSRTFNIIFYSWGPTRCRRRKLGTIRAATWLKAHGRALDRFPETGKLAFGRVAVEEPPARIPTACAGKAGRPPGWRPGSKPKKPHPRRIGDRSRS
jgi:hypothetical protein